MLVRTRKHGGPAAKREAQLLMAVSVDAQAELYVVRRDVIRRVARRRAGGEPQAHRQGERQRDRRPLVRACIC